jgi:hypothetical protein
MIVVQILATRYQPSSSHISSTQDALQLKRRPIPRLVIRPQPSSPTRNFKGTTKDDSRQDPPHPMPQRHAEMQDYVIFPSLCQRKHVEGPTMSRAYASRAQRRRSWRYQPTGMECSCTDSIQRGRCLRLFKKKRLG